jgi:hypothetical protein
MSANKIFTDGDIGTLSDLGQDSRVRLSVLGQFRRADLSVRSNSSRRPRFDCRVVIRLRPALLRPTLGNEARVSAVIAGQRGDRVRFQPSPTARES